MKFKNQIFLLIICGSLVLSGCTPTLPVTVDEEINYSQEIDLPSEEYPKLIYLLEGVIDIENDSPDTWDKPLSTDEQKGAFVFNILNNNYMDKYENPEEAPDNLYYYHYPILEDSFIPNDGDAHDGVFPIDETVKVAYKKSDIDQILNDIVGNTLKDGTKITQDGMILSGDKYLLFTYEYYGSDLIGNKGRGTRFTIDGIKQASEKDIEVKARYWDDALENGGVFGDYGETNCYLTYHISKNPGSFYGYTVNEYMYTGCKIDKDYIAPDFPSQLVYGIYNDGVYSDFITLKRGFETRELSIDLNRDGTEEYFAIGPDNPNGTKILGIVGNKGYNFIYDFTHEIVDDYNDLLDGLFVEMYFTDLDGGNDLEIIVVVGDKKTWLEANIYKLGGEEGFAKLGTIYGKDYLDYDEDSMVIHAPYSNNGVCQMYEVTNGGIFKI